MKGGGGEAGAVKGWLRSKELIRGRMLVLRSLLWMMGVLMARKKSSSNFSTCMVKTEYF
uniref:Uncharacterized protein n=1 Tax=Brassica oleracea var. oleracea TaxID=109376 RepID=A0A0D3ECJ3_BRAOL